MAGETLERTRYTFDWRPAEQARATRSLMRRRMRSGPVRWILLAVWVFLVISAVFTALLVLAGDVGGAVRVGVLAAACAVLLGAFPHPAAWLQSRIMARTDPNVAHPIVFELRPDSLRVTLRTHASELQWSGVPEVREIDGLVLIHYSALAAYYLPTRVVGSDAAVQDLLEWLRERTGQVEI